MVRVKLFANFREVAGVKEDEIEAKSLEELFKKLVEKYPMLEKLIFDDDKLRNYINVMVNGKNVRALERLNTKLNDDDVVAIFPPISGG